MRTMSVEELEKAEKNLMAILKRMQELEERIKKAEAK